MTITVLIPEHVKDVLFELAKCASWVMTPPYSLSDHATCPRTF
jgi:hypothetical protein